MFFSSTISELLFDVGLNSMLLWILILFTGFAIIIKLSFKNASPDKEPGTIQLLVENFVTGFDNLMDSVTGGRLRKVYPYFFSLFLFLLFTVFLTFFGFESPALYPVFTFTLGMVTFIGIYVVGIVSKGLWGFIKHKYKNPMELIQQFAPLLSISVRLFGATFGFSIIVIIFPIILQSFGMEVFVKLYLPFLTLPVTWILKGADIFLSLIQAFVFMMLTVTYWSLELPETNKETKEERKAIKAKDKQKTLKQKQKNKNLIKTNIDKKQINK